MIPRSRALRGSACKPAPCHSPRKYATQRRLWHIRKAVTMFQLGPWAPKLASDRAKDAAHLTVSRQLNAGDAHVPCDLPKRWLHKFDSTATVEREEPNV